MAKFALVGLEVFETNLRKLKDLSQDEIEKVVNAGAGVVADEIRKGIDGIPVDNSFGTPEKKSNGIKAIQKKGLQHNFGISPVKNDNGFVNVKCGFAGYNTLKTKKHPQGQPNAMIARSVESGTSFMDKMPFFKKAVNKTKKQAIEKMQIAMDEILKNKIN